MPSRLKSLELHGYKTFASRTPFEFAGTITAIVGPNGSGKSNIADSLRWVLGEQSYSLLRGKKTEDMIFSGSEQRPRAGMASATVVFDNTDGWLPIEFSEVAVARRAYRDGSNEYLINGHKVRLKDVSELLAQSGLAERTYTIIGQGVVDAALALKPEERRRLFEEAAGIGLYRSRREEAIRRLETTRRNLDRVQDILAELQPRLRSLERQARRAQEYDQVRADLKLLLLEWYGYHWHNAQQELSESREFARRQEKELNKARQVLENMDEKLSEARERIHSMRARLSSWHHQQAALHTRQESLGRLLAVADERRRMLETQQVELGTSQTRLEEELALQQQRFEAASAEAVRLEAEAGDASRQALSARQLLQQRLTERQAKEGALEAARQELSALESRKVLFEARLGERHAQEERLAKTLSAVENAIEKSNSELGILQEQVEADRRSVEEAEATREQSAKDLDDARQQADELGAERRKIQSELQLIEAELARMRAQAGVLEQADSELAGYAEGARILLKAARGSRLRASVQSLGAQLEMSAELETAIAAALGEYMDGVLLEQSAGTDEALDLLSGQGARGVLLPLDGVHPMVFDHSRFSQDQDGYVGLASELVSCDLALRPAIDLVLGRTLIVRDRQAARRILATIDKSYSTADPRSDLRAVTLRGEVFHAAGPIIAGQEGKQTTLSRTRQRKELEARISTLESRTTDSRESLQALDELIESHQAQIAVMENQLRRTRQAADQAAEAHRRSQTAYEKYSREAAWQVEQRLRIRSEIEIGETERGRIANELSGLETLLDSAREAVRQCSQALGNLPLEDFQAEAGHWNTQAAVAERIAAESATRCQERQAAVEAATAQLAAARHRYEETAQALETMELEKQQQRQEESQVSAEIASLRELILPAENELEEAESAQAGMQGADAAARQALSQAEAHHAQARINLARRQEALETWRRRIEDDFGLVVFDYADEVSGPTPLPLQGLVEQLPRVDQLGADVEENVRRQRAQLRRMGPVNPEAQAEYLEVKERFQFMTTQVADLEKAETDVRQVIKELDELMESELRKTFDAAAGEFGDIFKRLFGGGSARLVLTDPEDMTVTGIDIEARLPGRRTQGLSLLSGGERSLTAVSLVFALLKVSPTPFCVLDEVDAMLDEANVGRFRELLSELSAETQFIIVTHNRNTVQVADVIYGVTMGRDSTSQVISLKLDQVPEIVE